MLKSASFFVFGRTVKFTKPPLTIPEQLALLKSRGLAVPDEDLAARELTHSGYYRLSGYWLPFEKSSSTPLREHLFQAGAGFDTALDLCRFDRQLRLLVLEAIELVEVSIRTSWAREVSLEQGSHAYLDPGNFHRRDRYDRNWQKLQADIDTSHEIFIAHYRSKYSDPKWPPIWMIAEIMTLGTLSKWYTNLGSQKIRKRIAKVYGLQAPLLDSALHNLTLVRNICAHHARLWDRHLPVSLKQPHAGLAGLPALLLGGDSQYRVANSLLLLASLTCTIDPSVRWGVRLAELLSKSELPFPRMGIPDRDAFCRSLETLA